MPETKILLDESEIPGHWYNVIADMPNPPAPYLGPDGKPLGPDAMARIFPDALIEQEVSRERWIPIPEEVRELLRLWRPSPLYRAHRLEAALGTPAKIYYKYEGVSPAGSHKPNTALAQGWYNKQAGIKRLATETGAGQWGSALALVGEMFGIQVRVYMVKVSYHQKPFRRSMMETWGAEVFASPTDQTASGRQILAQDPDSPGSLGIAISEAVPQLATFEAGVLFARSEGIIPAPESNHAIRACIDEAERCKESGEPKTLFFNLSGHGHFDMASYDKYFNGELEDYEYPEQAIEEALEHLPKVAGRA